MSEYKDIKNNTYKITHTILASVEDKEQTKKDIVEELYKIFTHK